MTKVIATAAIFSLLCAALSIAADLFQAQPSPIQDLVPVARDTIMFCFGALAGAVCTAVAVKEFQRRRLLTTLSK